ncbi:MAG: cyclic lactone autoinducer peptide [Thermincola sp.]|nr:cyclic lactone autoinducer peptide [Thermincola sp.]MDT3701934.1 cyclic lactone autoinducer peptide [Thermincola sp.]
MFKKIEKLVKRYGYHAATFAAAALVVISNTGAGTFSWAYTYQPEPPK